MKKEAIPNNRAISRAIAAAFITALFLKCFFFDFMITGGRSMLPSIEPGTVLMVNRLAYGFKLPGVNRYLLRWGLPRSGDVVVFITPQGSTAVKRCEAAAAQKFFARGDNSLESYDSRSYGPVPADSVIGKVMGLHKQGGSNEQL
jgi:signal peptidase I